MIFGLSDTTDPLVAARVLEAHAVAFEGTRGPRIDYIPVRENAKVALDPLKTIRSVISFKLADVDPQGLAFGVIESFLEFVGNELNEIQQSMNTTAVAIYGSLLDNKDLFAKIATEAGTSHTVYFNNQLPVDGRNALYGGASF
jgi:hydrogenase maturation factor HypF (carbamoyltransferase family)